MWRPSRSWILQIWSVESVIQVFRIPWVLDSEIVATAATLKLVVVLSKFRYRWSEMVWPKSVLLCTMWQKTWTWNFQKQKDGKNSKCKHSWSPSNKENVCSLQASSSESGLCQCEKTNQYARTMVHHRNVHGSTQCHSATALLYPTGSDH